MKTFLSDLDGTIANSFELGIVPHNRFAEENGDIRTIQEEDLEHLRKLGYYRTLRHLNMSPFQFLQVRKLTDQYMPGIAHLVPAYEGMPELITTLAATPEVKTGVVSSSNKEYIDTFLKKYDIDGLDIVQGGAGFIFKGRALRRALKEINSKPQESYYICDEPRDVKAARRVGMYTIGVSWGIGGVSGFEKHAPPDCLVHDPDELQAKIEILLLTH